MSSRGLLKVKLVQGRPAQQTYLSKEAIDEGINGQLGLIKQILLAMRPQCPKIIVTNDDSTHLAQHERQCKVQQHVRTLVTAIDVNEIE